MAEQEADAAKKANFLIQAIQLGGSLKSALSITRLAYTSGLDRFGEDKEVVKNAARRCVYAFPLDPDVWSVHGQCLEDGHCYSAAIFAYEVSLELRRRKSGSKYVADSLCLGIARVYSKLEKWEDGLKWFAETKLEYCLDKFFFAKCLFMVIDI